MAATLRDVKRDMTDKWSELVTIMSKYEKMVNENENKGGKGLGTDVVRLRVENEDLKIKVKVIENKWKQFKDEAIKNEVKLEKRIKQLESTNKRLRETIEKQNSASVKIESSKRKRAVPDDDADDQNTDDDEEKFGSVRVVADPKRVRFHQDAIINGKRQRKPKFSHLKDEYAIDMQGMDKKLLDADDDVAGVGGEDDGELVEDDDEDEEDSWCDECNKSLGTNRRLKRHLRDVHGVLNPGSVYNCDQCDIVLVSAVAYNRHMKYLHGQDEKPFICEVCNVAFATKANLQSHIDNKVHEKKGIEATGEKDKKSEEPTAVKEKDGKIVVVQAPPKRGPKGGKRNVCPLCFMVFPTTAGMNEHLKKHRQTKVASTTFVCEYCEEIFYKKTALNEHESRCPKNKSEDEKLWETIVFPDAEDVLREQANYKDESLIDPVLGPTDDYQGSITLTEPDAGSTASTDEKVLIEKDTSGTAVTSEVTEGQLETVSIVDESGQTLGQAQVSVDPVSGSVTYVAFDQNGEQLPLSRVLEGAGTSELLLSLVNQATTSKTN